MTIASVASSTITQSSTGNNVTSATGSNTTGANLLVAIVSCFQAGGTFTSFSDAVGGVTTSNSWTMLGPWGTWAGIRIYYCINPATVGANHTLTVNTNQQFPSVELLSFSGVSALDKSAGNTGASGTGLSISLTPRSDSELIISAISGGSGGSTDYSAAPATLSLIAHAVATGNAFAVGSAYIINGTGTGGVNIAGSWTQTGTPTQAPGGGVVAFTASAGGGGSVILPPYLFDTMAI